MLLLLAGPDRRGRRLRGQGAGSKRPASSPSHYAPSKPLRLNAAEAAADEFLIGFGEVSGDVNLSAGNLVEAAARLFDLLHVADESGSRASPLLPCLNTGLGPPLTTGFAVRLLRARFLDDWAHWAFCDESVRALRQPATGGSLTLSAPISGIGASAAAGGGVLTIPAHDVRNDFNGDGRRTCCCDTTMAG